MQNPKRKLENGHWYRIASDVLLHQSKSAYSPVLTTIPKGSMVMFVSYHPGTTRTCKVIYHDMIGWVMVDVRYSHHLHFFAKIKMDES